MLIELIEQFDIITIFRHIGADGDALGSQFGIKTFIQDQYPEKKVYALGLDIGSHGWLFDPVDEMVSDETIKNSLAIVLDTANASRVDDQRFVSANTILKIDHHPNGEAFGTYEIVDEKASATCEVVATLLRKANQKISKKCAKYLYYGLATDTNNFTIESVRSDTFFDAAYLMETGLNLGMINYDLVSKSKNVFEYETFLRDTMIIDEKVAYCIVNKEDYERFHLTFVEAKEKAYVLAGLRDIQIWCLFVEHSFDGDGKIYNGSLRSLSAPINEIASRYHGGGHKLACGVKQLTKDKILKLIDELKHAY